MVSKSQFVLAIVFMLLGWYTRLVDIGVGEFAAVCCQTFQIVTKLIVFTESTDLVGVSET